MFFGHSFLYIRSLCSSVRKRFVVAFVCLPVILTFLQESETTLKNMFCGGQILAKKQKQQQVFSPTVENTLGQLNTGLIQNAAFLPG